VERLPRPPFDGAPKVEESFGTVALSIAGDEPWIGLRNDWSSAAASLLEFQGRMNLGHRLLRAASNDIEPPGTAATG
jgi:hypothetical protein